jgi:uncharacterized membrane protein YbaN (DUF454 family)
VKTTPNVSLWRSPRRVLLAALGLICIGLAFLGVLLPGLPTTIFLIAASYLFARSFPELAERLLQLPVFRPFLPYVRGDQPIPRRARVVSMVVMWVAVTISLTLLFLGGRLSFWVGTLIVGAALIGSLSIATVRR